MSQIIHQILVAKTFNELHYFYNEGISKIILNYLIITVDQYLEDYKRYMIEQTRPPILEEILLPSILHDRNYSYEVLNSICKICRRTIQEAYIVNEDNYLSLFPDTQSTKRCLRCLPYIFTEKSRHVQDFQVSHIGIYCENCGIKLEADYYVDYLCWTCDFKKNCVLL